MWLRDAIEGLLTRPSSVDAAGYPVFPNRIQELLHAPAIDEALQAHQ